MAERLRCVLPETVLTGWDFSTGAVKCLAFDLEGNTLAHVRLPTDLWTEGGVSELNLMQLEGQARASVRQLAARLRELGRLKDWAAGPTARSGTRKRPAASRSRSSSSPARSSPKRRSAS